MTTPSTPTDPDAGQAGRFIRLLLVMAVVLTVCWAPPIRNWLTGRFNSVTHHVGKNLGSSIVNSIDQQTTTTTVEGG